MRVFIGQRNERVFYSLYVREENIAGGGGKGWKLWRVAVVEAGDGL